MVQNINSPNILGTVIGSQQALDLQQQNQLLNQQRLFQIGQAEQQAPIQNRLLQAQTQQAEQDIGATDLRIMQSKAKKINEIAQLARNVTDVNQRSQIINRNRSELNDLGFSNAQIDQAIQDDSILDNLIAETSAFALPGGVKIGSQEILDDGTIIQSTPEGPRVFAPTGELLSGNAAAEQVKNARKFESNLQRERSAAREEGKLSEQIGTKAFIKGEEVAASAAIKRSEQAFNRLSVIRKNISNIDEAIALIDDNAGTGPILSKLPSIKASSVKLDNLQGRLGLDVLGDTTFGALSAAELKFALSTALPLKLKGADLRSWLSEKKDVQEKLADYLESAAIFLGKPGNTTTDWAEFQKKKREASAGAQQSQDGTITLPSGVIVRRVK